MCYQFMVNRLRRTGAFTDFFFFLLPRSSFASVIIDVLDKNEWPPEFAETSYEVDILEEVENGHPVLTVQVQNISERMNIT